VLKAPSKLASLIELKLFVLNVAFTQEKMMFRVPTSFRFLLLIVLAIGFTGAIRAADEDDEAAREAYYKKMTEAAEAKWPAMEMKFKPIEDFDPNDPMAFKGKIIRIETDNLMGYRFKPGDFPFATTLDGSPIAAKYDPVVKAAVAQAEKRLNRSLGDNDDDGRWTICARVEGTKGKLQRKVNVEGTVSDGKGNSAKVKGEKFETVDAPIITILAARIGPLAVSKEQGMVKEDGSIAKP
jgi:hypothetical protein